MVKGCARNSASIKRKRQAAAQPTKEAPIGGAATWRSHSRLQKHLRKFQNSQQAIVLQRYANASTQPIARQQLLRYTCHAGSWVALLDPEDAARPRGAEGDSPVSVLTKLLRNRGRGPLTPWLRGILLLVQEQLRGRSDLPPWKALCGTMPRLTDQRKLKHKHVMGETACNKNADLDNILKSLEAAIAGENIEALRAALSVACLALAPPRRRAKSEAEDGGHMEEDAIDRLQANMQSKLRVLVMKGFKKLDSGMLVSFWEEFSHLKNLISRFEKRSGSVDNAQCSNEWNRLKNLLGGAMPGVDSATEASSVRNKVPQRSIKSTAGGEFTPSENIRTKPEVHRGSPLLLTCTACGETLMSSWYFTFKGVTRLLKPNNGHYACNRAPYAAPAGVLCKADAPNTFPCAHGKDAANQCEICVANANRYTRRKKGHGDISQDSCSICQPFLA
eukprot:TRINITY_DN39742_c0_g1_i1.p1 TRINITY_DN39742_c0_g1~~TRINITY_DN39742_c0_g1_i1.p1  ORF type:complete len:447 (-),score=49.23 TRINITY_DN39742_c0_g1_i1:146-1486(-)